MNPLTTRHYDHGAGALWHIGQNMQAAVDSRGCRCGLSGQLVSADDHVYRVIASDRQDDGTLVVYGVRPAAQGSTVEDLTTLPAATCTMLTPWAVSCHCWMGGR